MKLKKFPGFIDVHVHLRDPGATHKEDFYTGSRAALAGGFTHILDMPNNPQPTITAARLKQKMTRAKKALCDVGFHFGTDGKNIKHFAYAYKNAKVFGLKIYCNHTTGNMLIEDLTLLENIFAAWNSDKPILVHAEGVQLAGAIALAQLYGRRLHVCHITQENEVELVRRAKSKKYRISAGVTPHHLFLTERDKKKMKGAAIMKPPLGTSKDQQALWEGLKDGTIDLVETDHAPHTKQEKRGNPTPFGVPGLETVLGLLFKAVHDKKLKEYDVVRLLHTNARKIFSLPVQKNTFVECDPSQGYTVGVDGYESRCGWSSFDGWRLYGKPQTVVIGGKTLVQDGRVL